MTVTITLYKVSISIIIFLILLSVQGCIVSRTGRPELSGYIYDSETKKPLAGCKVGEVLTDTLGFYKLKEKRYVEFTFPGKEAPPLVIQEIVEKEGYKNDTIINFSKYEGGQRKGAYRHVDTVYLDRQ